MQFLEIIQRSTALLLQSLRLKQVLLCWMAWHFVGRIGLFKFVEFLANLDFR